MLELNLKTTSGDISSFKKIVVDGLSEERKKIDYALEKTNRIIKRYEDEYKMSSEEFLKRFKKDEIAEDDDTFTWWAELKVSKELEQKLVMVCLACPLFLPFF
jgi:hypothetical protein